MKAIIFSKNRAAQLDLLLRSMRKHFPRAHPRALVKFPTDDRVLDAYVKVATEHPQLTLVWEKDLKDDLLSLIPPGPVCFLVDDDVFYRDVPNVKVPHRGTFSLRLHDGIGFKHFDYLHSVDGNIYWGKDIRPCVEAIEFTNPNKLESRLQRFNKDFVLDHGEGYVVNCPHNRVSDGSHCEFTGRHTAKDLNNHFLRGERLHIDPVHFENLKDVHVDIPYAFRPASAS